INAGQEKSTELHWYDAEGDYIDSWSLIAANAVPWGITTDGTNIWVVDTGTDKVYKYDMDGTDVGSWELEDENHNCHRINPSTKLH
ncbi:unnamed protein product, partial [marine sediment metagenome]